MTDPYEELLDLARDLAARGTPDTEIIDACFRVAVNGAAVLCGDAAVAASLRDVAETMGGQPVPVLGGPVLSVTTIH